MGVCTVYNDLGGFLLPLIGFLLFFAFTFHVIFSFLSSYVVFLGSLAVAFLQPHLSTQPKKRVYIVSAHPIRSLTSLLSHWSLSSDQWGSNQVVQLRNLDGQSIE